MAEAYLGARDAAASIIAEKSLTIALCKVVAEGTTITMSPYQWLDRLTNAICGTDDKGRLKRRPSKSWPETERGLRAQLECDAPALRTLGLTVEFGLRSDHRKKTEWTVSREGASQ
jgi:hypothetical protein